MDRPKERKVAMRSVFHEDFVLSFLFLFSRADDFEQNGGPGFAKKTRFFARNESEFGGVIDFVGESYSFHAEEEESERINGKRAQTL